MRDGWRRFFSDLGVGTVGIMRRIRHGRIGFAEFIVLFYIIVCGAGIVATIILMVR